MTPKFERTTEKILAVVSLSLLSLGIAYSVFAHGPYGNWNAMAATIPAAPSNLMASGQCEDEDLSWTDNSTNENGCNIQRCQGATCTNFATITQVGPGVTTYHDTGLLDGTTYRYRVNAYNTAGSSAYSNMASATTNSASACPTPTPTPTPTATPPPPSIAF